MKKIKYAVCKLEKSGIVYFVQKKNQTQVICDIYNKKLKEGLHGLHIHKYGDLTNGCDSTCEHYNPTNETHGDRTGYPRHRGDLGNVQVLGNKCQDIFFADVNVDEIIGRALIIHEDKDDLGLLDTESSKTTGSAGKRFDCGVIGICKNPQTKLERILESRNMSYSL